VSALSVSLPWRGALLACAAFAKRFSAFVTTGGLADCVPQAASQVCHLQPAEQLHVNINTEQHTVTVYEVLGERDDDDDEWMYVMSKQGEGAKSVHRRAFDHCATGEYAQAVALLSNPDASSSGESTSMLSQSLAENMLERAEVAMLAAPKYFAARQCHCGAEN
jgi:hypothetical protein